MIDAALPVVYALPVAALLLALGWRPWRAGTERRAGAWAGAAALSLAFAAVYGAHERALPALPPTLLKDLVLCGGLVWIVLAALERRGVAWGVLAHLVFGGLAGYTLWTGLEVYRTRHWVDDQPELRVALLGVLWLVHFALLRASLLRRPAHPFGALALLTALGFGAATLAQSYLGAALPLGGLAVVVGGAWVIGLWRRDLPTLAGLAQPLAWLSGGALLLGPLFGETPWASTALLALAFHVGWSSAGETRMHGALRVALTAALGALALHLALPEPSTSTSSTGIDYSEY